MSTLHGEYRRHSRTGIRTAVNLTIEDNALPTQTRDVSQSGLSVDAPIDADLEMGDIIYVSFSNNTALKVPAKVVRLSEQNIGLELEYSRFSPADIKAIIDSAPFFEKLKTHCQLALWRQARQLGLLIINTVLRRILVTLVKPTFLFAVYGNEKGAQNYYSPSTAKLLPTLIIGSFIINRGQRGLLLGSKFYENELATNPNKIHAYLNALKREFPKVKAIALAGRLPNFVSKAGIAIEPPYIDGSTGTRFLIWDIAQKIREDENYCNDGIITVIGGAGRIGNKVCEDLAADFATVIAFDSRYDRFQEVKTPSGQIFRTNDIQYLKKSRIVIHLAHHGDVISEIMHYLPEHTLIADDTHPSISTAVRQQAELMGLTVKKTVLHHTQFTMWPRMPGWSNRSIPGCLMETLVAVSRPEDVKDFRKFCKSAREMGFAGQLVKPLDN